MEHHGELQGGAAFAKDGKGLTLDGVGEFVLVPESIAPVVDGEITMMAMVRANLPLPTTPEHQVIVTLADDDEETWLRLRGESVQGGSWWGDALNAAEFNLFEAWAEPAYHHLAARYDGTHWAVFHDGELVVSVEAAVGALPASGPLSLGGRPGGRYFNGDLREVRIYSVSIGDDEIAEIAARGIAAAK
jgi:hypothetical protein